MMVMRTHASSHPEHEGTPWFSMKAILVLVGCNELVAEVLERFSTFHRALQGDSSYISTKRRHSVTRHTLTRILHTEGLDCLFNIRSFSPQMLDFRLPDHLL